jgi:F-type H+-transporting ATPase subunit delta
MKKAKETKRKAKRLFRLCLVNGFLDEDRTRQVVQKVIDSKRRGGLALLSHLERLVRLERARHTAEVKSALPLPADMRSDIEDALARAYGPGITATFAQEPELIGGMRIKVGSDVYDGSLRGRLAALEKRFPD